TARGTPEVRLRLGGLRVSTHPPPQRRGEPPILQVLPSMSLRQQKTRTRSGKVPIAVDVATSCFQNDYVTKTSAVLRTLWEVQRRLGSAAGPGAVSLKRSEGLES